MTLRRLLPLAALTAFLAQATPSAAFPGFFAGKSDAPRKSFQTHLAVAMKGTDRVITVMPDYDGPMEPFAVVLPVPADVALDHVKTLRREAIDRLDQFSAPKFHEYWESDPCEPGPVQQEWERDLTARASTNFLGIEVPQGSEEAKVPPELRLQGEPEFKDGEYTFSLITNEEAKDLSGSLAKLDLKPPAGAAEALKTYLDRGMQLLVARVDANRVELGKGSRALLSPIRYSTRTVLPLPVRLGLIHAPAKQDLVLYVIAPDQRYVPKGYEMIFPPTDLHVSFDVKERMSEFYNGVHDRLLEKHPAAFLTEFVWSTESCSEPCPDVKILLHELLTIGGDFFEEFVTDEEKKPEPPAITEKEEQRFKDMEKNAKEVMKDKSLKPKERKDAAKKIKDEIKRLKQQRIDLAIRKALLGRQKYVLTRLHHRYDAKTLAADIELDPVPPVRGGIDIPKGEHGEQAHDVKPGADNKMQTRFDFFHPWIGVLHCEAPERYKWAKAPRDYRGLRKIWTAIDLTNKKRDLFQLDKVVETASAELGVAGFTPLPEGAPAPSASASAGEGEKKSGCSVARPGTASDASLAWIGLGLAAAALRRRRARPRSV